jgi:seryl-tRNA synthetase
MLDRKSLVNDIKSFKEVIQRRNFAFDDNYLLELENERKKHQIKTQELQKLRNTYTKSIAKAKSNNENPKPLLDKVADLGAMLDKEKSLLKIVQDKINSFLMNIPNILHESVPLGKSEDENIEVSSWGKPKEFDFMVKDHVDLGKKYGLDFTTATKISGARFVVMTNQIALLHRALAQFMLDYHTKNDYQEAYVPYLVNTDSATNTGQLPKFEEDLFKTSLNNNKDKDKVFYLIPTAEIPLINMFSDTIIKEQDLPIKFVAHTPSFRSEAGSYGRDTRGLIRQHQFDKVELIQVTKPENSYQALEDITCDAENILKDLELPYRKMLLCSGDVGFSSAKTYDLEVWLPGQKKYREISSCSNCEAFQARRLKLRFKDKDDNAILLHTLNGSGVAIGRALVAVLENYQQADGSIKIPTVLQKYMNFKKEIK